MSLLTTLLRLLHIISAFTWFGLGTALAIFVLPAVIATGESGLRFMKGLFAHSPFRMAFPIASGMTTLMGLLLYIFGGASGHFSSTGNIVLGIGALAGLAATIHGGAVTGRETNALGAALTEKVPDDGPIAPDSASALRELLIKLAADARIGFVLMVVALIGMGSARYL